MARAREPIAGQLQFPMYYPTSRVTASFAPPDMVRPYMLNGHVAYVVVVAQGGLGQYYDLEGTTWQNPPILSSPSGTKTVNGKQLLLFTNGSKLSVVAWKTSQGVYWISNTLTDDLTNSQMVAIAASLTRAGGR